jgi:hypothetical protein
MTDAELSEAIVKLVNSEDYDKIANFLYRAIREGLLAENTLAMVLQNISLNGEVKAMKKATKGLDKVQKVEVTNPVITTSPVKVDSGWDGGMGGPHEW